MIALEVTPAVLTEAEAREVDTLLTHHPLIFKPLKCVVEDGYITSLVMRMVRREMNLVAAHTNVDSIADGTNGEIADRLELGPREYLVPKFDNAGECKYVVFVPLSHLDAVIEAVHEAGAGIIGDYSHCTFRSPGTGTFKPLEGANPYTGSVGEMEHAKDEVRLETVCPKNHLGALIEAVASAHPYEEPAFDVYPLLGDPKPTAGLGGASPADMTSTEVGAREVERLIGRLEHGVFS